MDIKTMHIGLDLMLQRINSNLFQKYKHEEKDYFINSVIKQLIRAVLLKEENTVYSIVSYSDIREYYDTLQPYIKSINIPLSNSDGEGYVYGSLPSGFTTDSQTTGILKKGIKYKVQTAGVATDFANVGAVTALWVDGYEFLCDTDNLTGTTVDIVQGETYRVINTGDADTEFAVSGLPHCIAGTQWTAIADQVAIGGWSLNKNPTLEHITDAPDAWGGATIIPVNNDNHFLTICTRSNVNYGNPISSGNLSDNKSYNVDTIGATATDFSGHGGYVYTGKNVIFIYNHTGIAITWSGFTVLYLTKIVENRLLKYQDLYNALDNSFGSVITSPISVIANNEIRVYHQNDFQINRVYLDYIREPIEVSYTNSINTDLPVNLHDKLVEITAQFISAVNNNPAYEKILNENKNNE